MKNTLFPQTGATSASFNFLKKVIKNLFQKSLIYLVIFCFIFSPIFSVPTVFAQEISPDVSTESVIQNDLVPLQIDPVDQITDPQDDKTLDTDVVNNTEDPIDTITNLEETPEESINPVEEQMQELSSNSSSGETENPTGKVDGIYGSKPKTDLITGAMIYNYPISVPQGRQGMTPGLELDYNSQENDNGSVFGYAWGTNIPYIERVNKNGSEKLYSEKYFTSSIDGELIESSPGVYIPRVDNGSFHKYVFTGSSWELTDKSGVVYKFGSSANSRQDNASNTNQVYKWMLDEKREPNNNYISYEYYKDSGQIYPQKITYTNHGSSIGIFEIEFLRQSRPDTYTSYKTAFEVITKYRINEIQAKLNGSWVRKYSLTYTTGDNGYRSLIETITSSAKDKNGTITTLPQTKFTYQKTTSGWTVDNTTWTSPTPLFNGFQQAIDIKGDGWVDILGSFDQYGQGQATGALRYYKYLYNHNTNKSWIEDTSFNIPIMFLTFEDRGGNRAVWDQGVRIADINGDQLNDLVQAMVGNPNNTKNPDIFNSYLYSRANGWVKDSNWVARIPFTGSDEIHDFGTHLIDINGDTLPDIIRKQAGNFEQLNTGSGFANITQNWTPPTDALTFTTNRLIDVNADGLPDALESNTYNLVPRINTFLNKGDTGWSSNKTNWTSPILFANTNYDQGVRFLDVNADNLIDIVIDPVNQTGGNRGTYLNTGNGWVYKPAWDMVTPNGSLMGDPIVIADIDSDGFIDFLKTNNGSSPQTVAYMNKGNKIPDLLSKIEYGAGGSSEIKYKKSAQYKDAQGNLLNPVLPMNLNTVESITNNDGLGHIAKTSYEYADGSYYYNNAFDRKFAGFGKVTQINPDNSKDISYYSQANTNDTANGEYDDSYAKISKVYRTDTLDVNNNLLKQNITKWESSQIGTTPAYFAYPVQTISRIFTGSNSYDTAEGYTYSTTNGNLTDKTNYGTVTSTGYQSFTDTGNDFMKTTYTYTNTNNLQLPIKVLVEDVNNNKISEKKLYYDNLLFGVASLGNNTSEESWISGSTYSTASKSYNIYGMPISATDSMGNTTNINYDTYNLYPSSITNALSQTTNYIYEYNTGKAIQTIDPNGTINEVDYDGFGRPLALRSSSDTSYSSLINKALYTYNDTMGSGGNVPYVQKTTNYSSTLSGTSYSLLDGFGREIRSVIQSSPTTYVASDTVYNNMGRVSQKSLPYNLSGMPTNYSGPTINTNIITTTNYDTLGRATSITNSLGTTNSNYNLNKVTITDPENHIKDIVRDAYGNIVQVVEHNGSNTYTTNYSWDTLGNLIGMTDALGNVRSFTYDAQGNRLTATDLHDPADTAYGSYSYTYNKNNNLIRKVTPNGNVIDYAYDALGRMTRESNNSVAQINYTYDTCANGIGMLCGVNRAGSSLKTFTYTNRGLNLSDITTLGPKVWDMLYEYDYQGSLVKIKYPDNSSVRYVYDVRGLITRIEKQELGTGAWADVITSINYNDLGQKTSVNYANGRTQNYTYDTTKQYQLTRNLLDAPTGYTYPNFFDTHYVWSPTGNLTQKTENFNLINPQSFSYTYDDLSRLTAVTKTVNSPLTGYTENYSYDAIGNITSNTSAGNYTYNSTATGVYANPNAGTTIGSRDYVYDRNGNVTGFGTSPNNTTLTYNYRNELTNYQKTAPPTPISNTYTYDYAGARIKTITSAGTTYTPSKYFDENATISKRYIYMGGQLVATAEVSTSPTPVMYYIHPDHLGGTQVVSDAGGMIKAQDLEYYPFGQILTNTKSGSFDESHKYTGHEYDTSTDLNFMQARYQYGKEGRFWSQDPIVRELDNSKLEALLVDPQRWNTYSYASNNPLKYIDPDGNISREALESRPLITASLFLATYLGSKMISGIANSGTYGTFMPSDFINHSLSLSANKTVSEPESYSSSGNTLNRNFDSSSELSMKIGESNEFKRAVEYKINGITKDSLQFDRSSDKDLGLSLQKTTINSLDIKETKGGYSVNANLTDNFLFVYNTRPGSRVPATNGAGIINNYAALMQKAGVISPFTSNINISRSYSKDDLGITK